MDLQADPETSIFADKSGVFVQVSGEDRRICLYPCSSGRMMNVVAFVPRNEVGEIKKGKDFFQITQTSWLQGHGLTVIIQA